MRIERKRVFTLFLYFNTAKILIYCVTSPKNHLKNTKSLKNNRFLPFF